MMKKLSKSVASLADDIEREEVRMRQKEKDTLQQLVSKHLSTSELIALRDRLTRYQAQVRVLDFTAQQLINVVNSFIAIGQVHEEVRETAPLNEYEYER